MKKKGSYTTRKYYDPMDDLLDRPIAFNPAFKKITGSTVAALMLSQAWYWAKRTNDEKGWFFKTQAEWEEETGLTRSEQETARKILRGLGILEDELRGIPATLYYRVNRGKCYELFGVQFAETLQSSLPEGDIQDSGILANINIETEITTGNKPVLEIPQNMPLEWYIQSGKPIPPELTQSAAAEKATLDEFESALGFGQLPWDTTREWEAFKKWVVKIPPGEWREYSEWREGKGKYNAMSNKQIRQNPRMFVDTGYPAFKASKAMYQDDDKPLRML